MPVDSQLEAVKLFPAANTGAFSSQEIERMARRRFQHGSVALRGKRELVWVARWREDVVDADGRLRRVRKNEVLGTKQEFPTKKLALRELQSRVAPVNQVTYRALRMETFAEFAKKWETTVLTQFKPSTQSSLKSQLRTALVPYFGPMKMREIHWQTIQTFISRCRLSPKTCKNHVQTLKMMWRSARAGGWVDHKPFEDLTLPKAVARAPFLYTSDDAKKIIESSDGQYKTLYWIAAETGLRPGELAALQPDNLKLAQFTIHVTHSAWGGALQVPKTANALRQISISQALADHLVGYLATWKTNPLNLLFVSSTDGPINPSALRRYHLGPLCKRLGIAAKGLKAFRHCNATMMDQAGVPMKVRQERLGHAPGSKVTMVHYTHAISADQRMAATLMGEMLAS